MLLLVFLALILTLTFQSYPVIESDVLFWLNKVRSDPTSIIPHLEMQLSRFKGKTIPIAPYFNYATNQGPNAWIEAIKYLKNQRPMGTLKRHPGLDKAAFDHAMDLKQYNSISHEGTDGSKPRHRIQKHCIYQMGQISQNIAQQFILEGRNHGLQTIVSLIVDDGVYKRGHRHSLFTQKYNYVGVNVQKTSQHYVVVLELSSHNLQIKNNLALYPIKDHTNRHIYSNANEFISRYQTSNPPQNINIHPQVHFKNYMHHGPSNPIIQTQNLYPKRFQ